MGRASSYGERGGSADARSRLFALELDEEARTGGTADDADDADDAGRSR